MKNPLATKKLTGKQISPLLTRLYDFLKDKPNKEKEIANFEGNALRNFYHFRTIANQITESELRNEEHFIKKAV